MMVVIVFAILIILYELIEYLYRNSDKHLNTLGGTGSFKYIPSNLEIVNIGSGPGRYAISYKNCDFKGFNLSTTPQNYKYGFRLLKRYRNNINKNAIIIIIIMCPLSFANNKDYNRLDYSDKFYGILPKNEIDGFTFKRFWITKHPLTIKALRRIKNKLIHNKANIKSLSDEPETVHNWKSEFELNNLYDASQANKHREAFKEKISILENGINFCKENGWRPVFVIPPVPKQTRDYISQEFLNEFVYKNIKVLQDEFKDIKTLDYFADERFTKEYFQNDIFVNEKGKEKFSNILFKDIDAKMKGENPCYQELKRN